MARRREGAPIARREKRSGMMRRMRPYVAAMIALGLAAMAPAGCKSNRGGGEGTGGAGGAATSSAGGAGGPAPGSGGAGDGGAADPCASAIFCDDFESYSAGAAPGGRWTVQTNSGAVSVDTAQSHSGTKAAKFTTLAKTGSKTAFMHLANAPVFPVAGNVYYGRMMFRLEAAPTASVHWTFIQGGGLVPGQTYHALYRYGGQLPITQGAAFVGNQLMANYETPDSYSGNGPSSDCWNHANQTVVPVGRWACVEWKFDGPNNQMSLWLDGVSVPALTVNGVGQGCVNQPATYPWTAPLFDRLDLGWESYQTDDARTLWIDDVVISASPIGCAP
jgi:hypothetical protein